MNESDNIPAFPCTVGPRSAEDVKAVRAELGVGLVEARSLLSHHSGMTLRDYFAGQALAGMLAADDAPYASAAELAYGYADALLRQRAKPPQEES